MLTLNAAEYGMAIRKVMREGGGAQKKFMQGKIERKKINAQRVAQKKCTCIRKKIFLQGKG